MMNIRGKMLDEKALDALIHDLRFPDPIYVTRPTLPKVGDYQRSVEQIWANRWLTNEGSFHKELERRLSEYLRVEHINLFCNGTIALMVALQALRINSGEVITTPFTFPATAHVLYWNKICPVFCDIEPDTFNLDPAKIERLISPETKALLPVHVFGNPCNVEAIQAIADRHGLHVIYDAAHCFGVQYKGCSILTHGEISMLSFHATKLFSTAEGGALAVNSRVLKDRVNSLKNFGITDEETVIGPGINGKMNELQAAFGLLVLDQVAEETAKRRTIAMLYRSLLADVPGIRHLEDQPDVVHNYGYFPVLVDPDAYGMGRDELHGILKQFNIVTRKYFYPLCTHYPCYAALPSARPECLPVAERVADNVLCMPLYGTMSEETCRLICRVVKEIARIAV